MNYTKQTLNHFWIAAMKYKKSVIIIMSGVLMFTMIDLVRPFFMKLMYDAMIKYTTYDSEVLILFCIFLGSGWLRMIFNRITERENHFFQPRVIADLINSSFAYLIMHSRQFYADNYVGGLQSKVKKFAGAFELMADQISFDLFRSVFLLILLNVLTYAWNTTYGFIVSGWLVFYLWFTYKFAMKKFPHDEANATQDSLINAKLSDAFANHNVIRMFAAEAREKNNFTSYTDKLFELKRKAWRMGWIANIYQGISMSILEVIAMGYAIHLYYSHSMTMGDVIFLQSYLGRIFDNTWGMGRYIRQIYEKIADANELTEKLESPHEVVDAKNAQPLVVKNAEIEFRNVVHYYHKDNPVINGLSLKIPAGSKVAFVGSSGAGKTTLVNALHREFDIISGEILIDNQDISQVTIESLRSNIDIIPQDTNLFAGTIAYNICYGNPNASYDEMINAAKLAYCDDFIQKLPNKYDTLVGERGIKLSGGQRQRVSIARAILSNAPILILDEATSSLDSASEYMIQKSLHQLMLNRTTIVIAHRLSTIKEADLICVIEHGQVVEIGSHQKLINKAAKYAQLWEIQVGGFENKDIAQCA